MKRIALALLAATASHAYAQTSSVTVFGVVDAAARVVDNEDAGSVKSLASGANQTSRIGFRGTEDLGGGLSAGFWLESGIALDAGTAGQSTPTGQFWDRRATVSLSGKALGEIRAGRDFVPSYLSWGRFDPFGYVGVGSSGNLITAAPTGAIRAAFGTSPNTTLRSSNSLQYLLPASWGSVQGGVMVAAGEGGTAATGQHKLAGARLAWVSGPWVVSGAYTTTQNNLTGSEKFKDTAIGGSWDLGFVKLAAAWRKFDFASAHQRNLLASAVVPAGAGVVNVSFNKADASGMVGATSIDGVDASQLALGYVHHLSKRTAFYTTLAVVDNDAGASYAVPGGPAVAGAGRKSTGFEFGVRHNF